MNTGERLQAESLARYGEEITAAPAMRATLAGAAAALDRLSNVVLDLAERGPSAPPSVAADELSWVADRRAGTPSDLLDLTASDAAVAIRTRQVSPVDLVEALLARAEDVDVHLQAWERLDGDRALDAARAAEAALVRGDVLGPLHGVPIGIKDIFDTAGLRTAAGFGPYDGRVPERDADVVARLREAGAIILGKTVATQFAFTDPSRTHNPWSPTHTPGGSSSGSGAAVAAREVPWAVGSQTAGSTLRPAAYNGVVGFKPTYGRVSTRGGFPLAWSLDTVGIITRCVADCGLFLRAAATDDLEGAASARDTLSSPAPPPRLGLVRDWVDIAEPEVREHVLRLAARFEAAGAHVREVRLTQPNDLMQAVHRVTILSEIAAAYSGLWESHGAELGPILRAGVQTGRLLPAHVYLQAQRLRLPLGEGLGAGLSDLDAYVCPTATGVAPGMETTGDPSLQVPATLVGFPAISLPSGLSAAGLPLAMQFIGARGQDWRLLRVAAWCEEQLGVMSSPEV